MSTSEMVATCEIFIPDKVYYLKHQLPFRTVIIRELLLARLNSLGLNFPAKKINGVPWIPLIKFVGDDNINNLLEVMDAFVANIDRVEVE